MKKFAKLLAAITMISTSTFLYACSASDNTSSANGIATKSVSVKEFNEIDVAQSINVIYTQGKLTPAKISAPESIIDYIKIEQEGKELKIRVNKEVSNTIVGMDRVQVQLSSTVLRDIEVSSAASVEIPKGLTLQGNLEASVSSAASLMIKNVKANRIELETSSAATASISNIDANIVEAEASSASNIKLSGKCTNLDAEASSGAEINAKSLVVQSAKAEANSGASINLNAQSLDLESNSGGSVSNVR